MEIFETEIRQAGPVLELLARASLQGALAVLAVWAVCRLFPRLPASLRCGLWWLACLKLVLGLVWTTPVPLPVLPSSERPSTLAVTAPLASSGAGTVFVASPAGEPARFPWALVLVGIWGAGVTGHLVWTAVQLRRMRGIVRGSEPLRETWIASLFAELRREIGVSPRAEVLAAEVETPQVLGLLRPRVLLPRRELSRLSPAELSMTLCHELLHVRRGDLWLGWVPAVAQRLFFFHPLARLAVREYALAREAACDAEVLRVLDPAPEAYGRLLLRLGVAPRVPRLAAAGAAPSFRTLKRRLEMLQQAAEKKRIHPAWWALIGLIALAVLIPFQMVAQGAEEVAPVRPTKPASATEPVIPAEPVLSVAPVARIASTSYAPPPAPPKPPAPPAPPKPPREGRHSWGQDNDQSYVVLMGNGSSFMNGSWSDLRRAKRHLGDNGKGVWFERDGKDYVIRDATTFRQIEELFKPQMELGERQGELGERQGQLGERQAKIGAQQAELGAKMAEIGARQARVAAEQTRGDEDDEGLEARMDELGEQMEALGRQMEKLGEPMEDLGRQQEELGRQQEELGRQQEKLAEQAQRQLRTILDRAISSGLAQEVR